jgi:glutamyl-tRNA synthetase
MSIRTRVAPSPTGDPHVGTAYMALFNYCFAKKHGGQFLLRIEDTDALRSTPQAERAILDALRWTGLTWDEGPDIGGPAGSYRQSERSVIYREHADRLLESGHAFRCFCTPERLEELRRSQAGQPVQGYDGRCLGLGPAEVGRLLAAGAPHTVRMKVPREGQCMVDDMLRGPIALDWSQVDYQVLLKSDGLPTYHLANVVDDHLMGITHVMRGEEWLTSAPKHLLLYAAFGWDAPRLCHMPLLRNPDKSKLSKRKNPTSILYYQRMGVLPEALLNYLGQMAWSFPDGREKFTVAEMVEAFDLSRISLGGPVFDVGKLFWLNGQWLRDLSDEQFADRACEWALNRDHLLPIVPLVKGRVQTLTDLVPLAGYLLAGVPDIDAGLLVSKKMEAPVVRRALWCALHRIDRMRVYGKAEVEEELRALADRFGVKLRDFLRPFYVASSGREAALPLFDVAEILGKDIFRTRLRYALDKLGAPTEAETREWGAWLEGVG